MSKYWEWFLLLYWTFWLFSAETFYRQYHLQPAFFCPMLNLPPGVLTGTVFFRDIPVDCKCITDISTDSTAAVTLSPSGEDLNQQKNTHTHAKSKRCAIIHLYPPNLDCPALIRTCFLPHVYSGALGLFLYPWQPYLRQPFITIL